MAQRTTYHELVGKHVVSADGADLGRVADLVAEPVDGDLRVTALEVGPRALLHRILHLGRSSDEIPWWTIERIDDRVHLRVRHDELKRLRP